MPKPLSPFVVSLLDLLSPLGGVTARRMFGGYGIYKDELFIGLVDGEEFYLRTDEITRPRFDELSLAPFSYTYPNGRTITMKYHLAPEEALTSPMRMKPWAMMAVEAARRAGSKPRAPNRRAGNLKRPE